MKHKNESEFMECTNPECIGRNNSEILSRKRKIFNRLQMGLDLPVLIKPNSQLSQIRKVAAAEYFEEIIPKTGH